MTFGNRVTEFFLEQWKNRGKSNYMVKNGIVKYIYIFNMLDKEVLLPGRFSRPSVCRTAKEDAIQR